LTALACRLAVRAGALSVAVLLGGGLAVGTAHADPVPTTTTVAPTTTTTTNSTPPTQTSEPTPSTSFPSTTTTAPPTGPGDLADLRVTAALDKRLYQRDELVRLTVTITNTGPVAASGVHGFGAGDLDVGGTWGELASDPGVTIDPGATRVVELSGHVTHTSGHFFQFNGSVLPANAGDANPNDNHFAVSGDVIGETGTFGGTIFTDLNGNRIVDPGESGVSGVSVRITGGDPFGQYERSTDAQGRFSFAGVPTGRYSVSYGNTGGWVVGGIDSIDLDTSDLNADVLIPATRSLTESLSVQARFDQDVYRAGDAVHLTVILTSRGAAALTGITARCNAAPDSPVLRGGPGWGPLDPTGPGVTLAAGQSAVVPVTEPLPDASPRFGYVQVFCELHAAGYPVGNVVFLSANARVIGPAGRGLGKVYEDRDGDFFFDEGEQVAGVTVLVKDQDTGEAVTSLVTDEHGEFTVDGLPSTTYDLRVTGPWKPRFDCCDEFHFTVNATDFVFPQTFAVVADPSQSYHRPNIKVSAAFDKPAYDSGDDVHARITVTNIGDAAAEGVRALQDCCGTGMLQVDFDAWGSCLSSPGRGRTSTRVRPGCSTSSVMSGTWTPGWSRLG
jgi:SdrD B-like domain/Carboxypeptidase regulatory-like domain